MAKDKPAKHVKEKIQRDENGKKIFTANSGMGFMRLIQIVNVFYICMTLFSLLLFTHSMLNDTAPLYIEMAVVMMLAQTMIVWLIAKRKRYSRYIIPALYMVEMVAHFIVSVMFYGFSLEITLECALLPVLLSIYFLTSRRAKAVLVQPFDVKALSKQDAAAKAMWNPKSVDFWMRLLIYFFAFSVLGHWMEIGVQVLVVNGIFPGTQASADSLTRRDVWNPFFIYGIAVSFCGLVLYPLYMKLREKMPRVWQAFLISFLLNAVFVVVAEIVLGMLFNADYHAWDYRNQFLNWNGQVCLLYSGAFALMASVITWVIYPFLEHVFSYASKDATRITFVLALVFFIFLYCTYNVDLTEAYKQAGIEEQMEESVPDTE